jgi:hypothetical protein
MAGSYTGYNEPIPSTCMECGNEECSPTLANLRAGQGGCKVCGSSRRASSKRTPLDTVIAIMDSVDIDYVGPFIDQITPTLGLHRPCGNPVSPRILSLLNRGGGCMACGYARRRGSWKSAREVPGYLYLLDFNLDGERFCKVGIGKAESGRIEQFQSHCAARIRQIAHASLAACYAAEQEIITAYCNESYLPTNPCLRSGHTECFNAGIDLRLSDWLPAE